MPRTRTTQTSGRRPAAWPSTRTTSADAARIVDDVLSARGDGRAARAPSVRRLADPARRWWPDEPGATVRSRRCPRATGAAEPHAPTASPLRPRAARRPRRPRRPDPRRRAGHDRRARRRRRLLRARWPPPAAVIGADDRGHRRVAGVEHVVVASPRPQRPVTLAARASPAPTACWRRRRAGHRRPGLRRRGRPPAVRRRSSDRATAGSPPPSSWWPAACASTCSPARPSCW